MPLEVERIKGICFDIDGTLSDTDDRWVQKLTRLLKPVHFMLAEHNARAAARFLVMAAETPANLLYTLLDHIGLDDEVGTLFSKLSKAEHPHSGRFWIIPGVKECLTTLEKQYPLAIVSARNQEGTLAFLNQFALLPMFQAVASAQTCRRTKPFPDPTIWAAEQLNLPPEHCLMVGDTTVDILSGRRAGMQTVGVLCGFGTARELRKAGADLLLPSTAALDQVLVCG